MRFLTLLLLSFKEAGTYDAVLAEVDGTMEPSR